VAEDVKPKLAVGDAVLLSRLQGAISKLILKAGSAFFRGGSRAVNDISAIHRFRSCSHQERPASQGHCADAWKRAGERAADRAGRTALPALGKLVHPIRILHTLPLSHVFGQTMGFGFHRSRGRGAL